MLPLKMLPFVKAHACGNDFLIIEESAIEGGHAELARRLCARNAGIGADGIEFLDRQRPGRPPGNFYLRLFNADGSQAELSGNGTRCVAAWLAESEGKQQVALGTHAGMRHCKVVERNGPVYLIMSTMGKPQVVPRAIEIDGVAGRIEGAMVDMGNPHFVIFVESEDFSSHGLSWQELGAKISVDPLFKFGTNVEFVKLLSPGEIAFRIYERGCGPTTSSGTGTCASSAAAIALRGANGELAAFAEGGMQTVVWQKREDAMLLTGPAEIICKGEAF